MGKSSSSFLSVPEYAAALGVTEQRVRQLVAAGRIRGARKVGTCWAIPAQERVQPPGHGPSSTRGAGMRSRSASVSARTILRQGAMRLAEQIDPVRILLFGSFARGTANRMSDLDLAVIVDKRDAVPHALAAARRCFANPYVGADVVAYDTKTFRALQSVPASLAHAIGKEGLLIYERGTGFTLGKPRAA